MAESYSSRSTSRKGTTSYNRNRLVMGMCRWMGSHFHNQKGIVEIVKMKIFYM